MTKVFPSEDGYDMLINTKQERVFWICNFMFRGCVHIMFALRGDLVYLLHLMRGGGRGQKLSCSCECNMYTTPHFHFMFQDISSKKQGGKIFFEIIIFFLTV